MIFMQMKVYERSECSDNRVKSVIFLILTYIHGKTRTTFKNIKTPPCSAHHSGPRFVKKLIGYWFYLLASVIMSSLNVLLQTTRIVSFHVWSCKGITTQQSMSVWKCPFGRIRVTSNTFYLARDLPVHGILRGANYGRAVAWWHDALVVKLYMNLLSEF